MNLQDKLLTMLTNKILDQEISESTTSTSKIDKYVLGKKVIIRTYSAGVHFGEVIEKEGNEIILKNSRRLYRWHTANNGVSLSEVANVGLATDSKVCSPVDILWLQPIEIILCTEIAIKNIEAQNEYKA